MVGIREVKQVKRDQAQVFSKTVGKFTFGLANVQKPTFGTPDTVDEVTGGTCQHHVT